MPPLRDFLSLPAASLVAGLGYSAMIQYAGADGVTFLPLAATASIVAFVHAVVLGLPVTLVLRRLHKLNLPYVLASSFLIGALPVPLLLMLSQRVFWPLREALLLFGSFGILGLIAGYTWFCIADLSRNQSLERTRER